MSTNNFGDVGRFHEKFGLPHTLRGDFGPREVGADLVSFRMNFLFEELGEFFEAVGAKVEVSEIVVAGARSVTAHLPREWDPETIDHAKAFDALIDLVYVALGTAHLFGYPWLQGWNAVQRANMSKVRAQADGSDSLRNSSFDVVKPPGWAPPDIEGLLNYYGWDCQ